MGLENYKLALELIEPRLLTALENGRDGYLTPKEYAKRDYEIESKKWGISIRIGKELIEVTIEDLVKDKLFIKHTEKDKYRTNLDSATISLEDRLTIDMKLKWLGNLLTSFVNLKKLPKTILPLPSANRVQYIARILLDSDVLRILSLCREKQHFSDIESACKNKIKGILLRMELLQDLGLLKKFKARGKDVLEHFKSEYENPLIIVESNELTLNFDYPKRRAFPRAKTIQFMGAYKTKELGIANP